MPPKRAWIGGGGRGGEGGGGTGSRKFGAKFPKIVSGKAVGVAWIDMKVDAL